LEWSSDQASVCVSWQPIIDYVNEKYDQYLPTSSTPAATGA